MYKYIYELCDVFMFLKHYADDGHYDFPLATLFSNGIIDNLVECCRYGHWHGVRVSITPYRLSTVFTM